MIYAPKGTQAMYVDPISEFGLDRNDYDSPKPSSDHENETIIQRGTSVVVTKAYQNASGKYVIECRITEQKHKRLNPDDYQY